MQTINLDNILAVNKRLYKIETKQKQLIQDGLIQLVKGGNPELAECIAKKLPMTIMCGEYLYPYFNKLMHPYVKVERIPNPLLKNTSIIYFLWEDLTLSSKDSVQNIIQPNINHLQS